MRRLGALTPLAVLAAIAAGCGHKAPVWHGTVQSGYVDIGRLAVSDPAWAKVAFCDRMIALLPPPSPSIAWSVPKPAELPSVPPLGKTHTDLALDQESRRLEVVRSRQIADLTQRLDESREYQLRVEGFEWRRDQRSKTDAEIQRINADYAQRVAAQTQVSDTKLINLQMQVDTLEKLTTVWSLAVPGIPQLAAARAELATKKQELDTETAARKNAYDAMRDEYRRQLADAAQQGVDAVQAIRQQRESDYQDADAGAIAKAQFRLQRSMNAVLQEVSAAENRSWIQASPPPAVTAAYRSPQLPSDLLTANAVFERARLIAERQRWVDYAYADTKLAVADIAARRHWRISLTKPGMGRNALGDMTKQVADALVSERRKANGDRIKLPGYTGTS